MKLALSVLLFATLVSAQKPKPTTAPPVTGGSGVSQVDVQHKPDQGQKADTNKPPEPVCTQSSPCFVKVEPPTESKDKQANAESLDRLYRRYLWATVVGVIGGLIGIGFIFWQTRIAARAANAARMNAESVITGDRAWILAGIGEVPDNFEPTSGTTEFLDVRPIIRNSGRTPGRIKRGLIRYYTVPKGSELPPEPNYEGGLAKKDVYILLPPNTDVQPLYVRIPFSEFVPVRQGNPTLYIYGFVDYVDFAEQERQSRFCFVYHVPGGFDPQPRGFYIAVDVPLSYNKCT